jgi:hypothetical protein
MCLLRSQELATNYSILRVFNRTEIWRAWVRVIFFSILNQIKCKILVDFTTKFEPHPSFPLTAYDLDFLMGFESYLLSSGRYKPTGKHRHSLRQVRLSLVCAQIFPRSQPMREYNTVRAIFLVCLCQRKNLLMSGPV